MKYTWKSHLSTVSTCNKCPRLIQHCKKTAKIKKKAFQNEPYWGKPVPPFGTPPANVFIIGLAPAAHGANRTGRMFTGDRSGEWLYRALHKVNLASSAMSFSKDDSLKLYKTIITATVKCAPPQNKPTPTEIQNCHPFLKYEFQEFEKNSQNTNKAYLCLGKLAFENTWRTLKELNLLNTTILVSKKIPKFKHGLNIQLNQKTTLFCSFHPSQQNTFTKKLTEPMFDEVFNRLIKHVNFSLQDLS